MGKQGQASGSGGRNAIMVVVAVSLLGAAGYLTWRALSAGGTGESDATEPTPVATNPNNPPKPMPPAERPKVNTRSPGG